MAYPMDEGIVQKNGEVIRLHTNRQEVVFAGLKKEFDIPLTRKEYPPLEYYIGCKFSKRIVVKISDILILQFIINKILLFYFELKFIIIIFFCI